MMTNEMRQRVDEMRQRVDEIVDNAIKGKCMNCGKESYYSTNNGGIDIDLCEYCNESADMLGYYGKKHLFLFDTIEEFNYYESKIKERKGENRMKNMKEITSIEINEYLPRYTNTHDKKKANKRVNHTDKNVCLSCGERSDFLLTSSKTDFIGIPLCDECSDFIEATEQRAVHWEDFFDSIEDYERYIYNNYKALIEANESICTNRLKPRF